MNWIDIAAIVFASVTVNHLGLIAAMERTVRHKLPILNCPKCLTFWSVLVYGLSGDGIITPTALAGGLTTALPSVLPRLLAISILSAYLAVWLELSEGIIDKLYDYVYKQIYTTADTADANTLDT